MATARPGNEIVEPLTEVGDISDPSIGAPVSMQLPEQVKGAVRVYHGPRGRGLECVRDVKRGEVLIGIPKKWAIDTMASKRGGSQGQARLCLELVKLRRAGDERVSHLPSSCDMPCFWSQQELEWLQGSYAYEPAASQRATLEAMHDHEQLRPPCTVEEFIWGMSMVQSRTFGGDGVMVFLPFIDLLNSQFDPSLGFDVRRADGYINVHASRDFKAGEEALVSYHGRQAPGLYTEFLAYGYVPTGSGVEYPTLFPWDASTSEAELTHLLVQWTQHVQDVSVSGKNLPSSALDEATESAAAGGGSGAARLAAAQTLLQHEKRMAVEQAVAIKKRLAALKQQAER